VIGSLFPLASKPTTAYSSLDKRQKNCLPGINTLGTTWTVRSYWSEQSTCFTVDCT